MTEQSLTGRNIAVRGYEPPDVGIVVSGVEVVPAGFDVEVIATVAERVDVRHVIRVYSKKAPLLTQNLYIFLLFSILN